MREIIPEKTPTTNANSDFQAGKPSGSQELLVWMIDVILADGKIEPGELDILWNYCEKQGVDKETVKNFVIQARKQGTLTATAPQSKEETLSWLQALILAGLADGSITRNELSILRLAGQKSGFSDFEINRLIFNIRQHLTHRQDKAQDNPFFG